MSRPLLGWMTAARALSEGLVADVAAKTGISKAEVKRRLSRARATVKVSELFHDAWPFFDEELGAATVAAAVEHGLGESICGVTGLGDRAMRQRLKGARGNVLLRKLFAAEWPRAIDFAEEMGRLTAMDATKRSAIVPRIAAISGLTERVVLKRLAAAHGRTLVRNVLADDWPRPKPHAAPKKTRARSSGKTSVRRASAMTIVRRASGRTIVRRSSAMTVARPSAGKITERLFQRYDVIERLTPGAMGEVFKVKDTTSGAVRFLKRVPIGAREQEASLRRETQIYDKLTKHRFAHVVKVHAIERDTDYFALVLDFAEGGALSDHVKNGGTASSADVQEIAIQIGTGLGELHALGVVHRDLKPGNVLRQGAAWKLADFGIARDIDAHATTTFQGGHTPGYGAPEQANMTEAKPSADVYSFGKVITFMLTKQTDPDRVVLPLWQDIVRRCTERDPRARPTAADVVRELQSFLL